MMIKKDSIFARLVASNVIIIFIITLTISFMSFYISEKLIINTFTSSNTKMLEQIQSNLIDFHNQILTISNNVSFNKSLKPYFINQPKDEYDLFLLLHGMQSYYKTFSPSLSYYNLKMIGVGVNNLSFASNKECSPLDYKVIQETYCPLVNINERPKIAYHFSSSGLTTTTANNNVIIASKALLDNIPRTIYGILLFEIDESRFGNIYDQTLAPDNTISIFSSDGTIISSSDKTMIGKNNQSLYTNAISLINEDIPSQNIVIDHTEYIMLTKYVPHLDFYIVNTINRKMALAPILRIKNFVFALSIFISLLTVCIIFFISRKISLPLIQIIGAMSDVKQGNFDKKICIDGSYEVRVLGRTFNVMLDA